MGICNCFTFCSASLYVHSCFAIILMGKRELAALLCLSSWCFVIVVWLFLTMPRVCLQFVNVVFPDHTHLLFLRKTSKMLGRRRVYKRPIRGTDTQFVTRFYFCHLQIEQARKEHRPVRIWIPAQRKRSLISLFVFRSKLVSREN